MVLTQIRILLLILLVCRCAGQNNTSNLTNWTNITDNCSIGPAPANFQDVETSSGNNSGVLVRTACMEYGACIGNGACSQYSYGLLCHQCIWAGTKSTRLHDGELCETCPAISILWIRLVFFYLFFVIVLMTLTYLQYRVVRAPLFTPAALVAQRRKENRTKKKRKEKMLAEAKAQGVMPPDEALEPDEDDSCANEQERGSSAVTSTLCVALARTILEHHVLCSLAWEFSGIKLTFPTSSRWLCGFITMDWFNTLSLACVAPSFFVDDILWYGLISCVVHAIVWSFVCLFGVFSGNMGCNCMRVEARFLTDEESVEKAFNATDVDASGKLTKEEILTAIREDAARQLPGPGWMTLGALMLLSFLQMPVYTRSFLYNLDCTVVSQQSVMRSDFQEPCSGAVYTIRLVCSIVCLVFFSFGSCLFAIVTICLARKQSRASVSKDTGEVTRDYSLAFAFFLSGLKGKFWFFSCWKMLLKEILPLVMILSRRDGEPLDPGITDAPGMLLVFGIVCFLLHNSWEPYDHLFAYPLSILESMTWIAFITAPLTKLLIGVRIEVSIDPLTGQNIIGRWTKTAETVWEWSLLIGSLLLYFAVFVAALFFLADEEWGFTKETTVHLSVEERIHVMLPKKGRARRQVCHCLGQLFEHSLLSVARQADSMGLQTLTPASIIEAALLLTMKEDALFWGDVDAGLHKVLNVESDSFAHALDLLEHDRKYKDILQNRAILDAGGLAEECLLGKRTVGLVEAVVDDKVVPTVGPAPLPNEPVAVPDAPNSLTNEAPPEASIIALNFSLERVELRSLGFKEGHRWSEKDVRPGVQRSLERGIAAAASAPESTIDLKVHPVGIDRALVTVAIYCPTEPDTLAREDWLRAALGTREARNRWAKSVEADLARVGVISSSGSRLFIRFNKVSKPQRTTEDGAVAIINAAIRAASVDEDATRDNYLGGNRIEDERDLNLSSSSRPPPAPVGRFGALDELGNQGSEVLGDGRPSRDKKLSAPRRSQPKKTSSRGSAGSRRGGGGGGVSTSPRAPPGKITF